MYPVVFVDAIHVKVRDGQVTNRPVYVVIGVSVHGERNILGPWAGDGGEGEGAKFWLSVLTELKNRGVADVCIAVCEGLKGLPDATSTTWPLATVQLSQRRLRVLSGRTEISRRHARARSTRSTPIPGLTLRRGPASNAAG